MPTMQPVTDPQQADELQEMGLLWWYHRSNDTWVLDDATVFNKPSATFHVHQFAIRVEE